MLRFSHPADWVGERHSVGRLWVTPRSDFSVTWMIDDIFSFPCFPVYMPSPEFEFEGRPWRMQMNKSQQNTISLMLESKGRPGSRLVVEWKLGVKHRDGSPFQSIGGVKSLEGEYKGWTNSLGVRVLQKNELSERKDEIAPEGCLTVYCDLSRVNDAKPPTLIPRIKAETTFEACTQTGTSISKLDKLAEDLEKLMLSGDGSDATVTVKGVELKIHKAVLGARIPVFASMFQHEMVERKTGVVKIDDCEVDTFKVFLHYVYSGKVENISSENVFGLHTVSDKYQVDELKAECLDFMKATLSVDTFCDIVTVALRYSERELLKLATIFFTQNMRKIIKTNQWQIFLRGNPTEANELIIKAVAHDSESE